MASLPHHSRRGIFRCFHRGQAVYRQDIITDKSHAAEMAVGFRRSLAMVREGIYGIDQVDPDGLHRQKRKAIAIIRGIGVHE